MSAKRILIAAGFCLTAAACGPNSQQNQAPPPAAAPPPPAAEAQPAQPAPPTDEQRLAKIRSEEARLERRQRALDEERAAARAASAQPPPCGDCGVVASITPVRQEGQAGWAGTLGGAAAGGLAGNQFGKGKGNMAMTALGIVGGAFAGREVEKQVTANTVYQVAVNMETGGVRMVTVANGQGLAPGMHVHVDGDSLLPY